MPNEPIAHLVWLQGRRAADDVEDYYEVARPGDKSVDGSDPFPVYVSLPHLAKPADGAIGGLIDRYWDLAYAEGQEGRQFDTPSGDAQRARYDLDRAIAALGAGTVAQEPVAWLWENPSFGKELMFKEPRATIDAQGWTGRPLYAAPPPPAAVQEPGPVKVTAPSPETNVRGSE